MALEQAGLEWVNQNLQGFLRGVDDANQKMLSIGDNAQRGQGGLAILSGAIMGVAGAITTELIGAVTKGIGALGNLATSSVNIAGQFQSASSRMNIAAGAAATETANQYGGLSEIALRVGADTRLMGVSASGAAESITDLLKAGIPLEDVLGNLGDYMNEDAQLAGILRASIDTAAASEFDMAEASRFAGATMKQFGLEADDMSGVMDYMIRSADASAASISDIRDGMANAGPAMKAFGFSVEDSADAIALLTNVGWSGAEAGTALRSMFSTMTKDSKKVTAALEAQGITLTDNAGNYLDFVDILGQIQVATEAMTEAERSDYLQTIAGMYGKTALMGLLGQGVQGYEDYQVAVANATGIQAQAEAKAATYAGQMEALQGTIETVKIRVGSALLPALTDMMGVFSDLINDYGPYLTTFFEGIGNAASTFVDVLQQLLSGSPGDFPWEDIFPPAVADIAYDISGAIENLIGYFTTLRESGNAANDFLGALPDALQGIVGTIGALMTGDMTVDELFPGLFNVLDSLKAWWDTNGPSIVSTATEVFNGIAEKVRWLASEIMPWITEKLDQLAAWWDENGANVSLAVQNIGKAIGFIGEQALSAWTFIKPIIDGLWEIYLTYAEVVAAIFAGDWDTVWQAFREGPSKAIEIIRNVLKGLATWVTGWFGTTWDNVLASWRNTWTQFGQIISQAWTAIKTGVTAAVQGVADFINGAWGALTDWVAGIWDTLRGNAVDNATSLWDSITEIWTGITTTITNAVQSVVDFVTSTWNGLVAIVQGIWQGIQDAILVIVGVLLAYLSGRTEEGNAMVLAIWERLQAAGIAIFNAIKDFLAGIWDVISTGAIVAWEGIKAALGAAWDWIQTTAGTVWEGIKTAITSVGDFFTVTIPQTWENIKTALGAAWDALWLAAQEKFEGLKTTVIEKFTTLKDALPTMWEEIKTSAVSKWQEFWDGVAEKIQGVYDSVTGKIDEVKDFLGGVNLLDLGSQIIQGLVDGIKAKVGDAVGAVTEVVDNIIESAKDKLGIRSPSTIFSSMGQLSSEGFVAGITGGQGNMAAAIQGALGAAADAGVAALGRLREMTGAAVTSINAALKGLSGDAISSVADAWKGLANFLESSWASLAKTAGALWSKIGEGAYTATSRATQSVKTVWTSLAALLKDQWTALGVTASDLWTTVADLTRAATERSRDILTDGWTAITDFLTTNWTTLSSTAKTAWDTVAGAINSATTLAVGLVKAAWTALEQSTAAMWTAILRTTRENGTLLVELYRTIMESLDLLFEEFDTAGIAKDIMKGLAEGIKSYAWYLLDAIRQVLEDAKAWARRILQIGSPSKVFMEMGEFSMEGFAVGAEKMGAYVSQSVGSALSQAVSAAQQQAEALALPLSMGGANAYGARGGPTSIDRSRTIQVSVNPTYQQMQSPASVYYDVTAALAAARV